MCYSECSTDFEDDCLCDNKSIDGGNVDIGIQVDPATFLVLKTTIISLFIQIRFRSKFLYGYF